VSDDKMVVVKTGYGLGTLCLAFLTGAAVGAVVALLNAKESGDQFRERLEERKDELRDLPASLMVAGAAAKNAFLDAYGREKAPDHGQS
jgi:gas vesicle protein